MASMVCANPECGAKYSGCSCQGPLCPKCKRAKRSGQRDRVTGGVQYQVTYRDGRESTTHDDYRDAHVARHKARLEGVRATIKTIRKPVQPEPEPAAAG